MDGCLKKNALTLCNRFGLEQKTKVRLIDDCGPINKCAGLREMDLSTRESGSLEGGWWGNRLDEKFPFGKIRFGEILPVPNFIPVVVRVQVMECSLVCLLGVIIAKLSTVQFWPAKSFLVEGG